ncbi:MAG: Mrp/NBP35 family ATP-binding protein [Deltaproteobacteria bacterium]|nr:Mrp/NBP35 family ATP-binding protein [Deltaproteobacteria bacterium]
MPTPEPTADSILAALAELRDPSAAGNPQLVAAGRVRVVLHPGTGVSVRLTIETGAGDDTRGAIEVAARDAIHQAFPGVSKLEVKFVQQSGSREITSEDPLPGVKNLILVMAGKGGVGKSTVASNVTMSLARSGFRVGLLDADIYGPSVPTMFGVGGRPVSHDGKLIEPLERFGIKLMSIGFLLEDPRAAIVWRGPMLHGALQQFLNDVNWGKLDYLIIDLPPGTGDVALTLSQKARATGAIIVTTPQEVALIDVYKAVSMCQKLNIPILGVVENESYFICDGCEKKHPLFGVGGGQKVAEMAEAPLLGQIPIEPNVRIWGDQGTPVVQAVPQSAIAKAFQDVADAVVTQVAKANASRIGTLSISREGMPTRLPIIR